MTMKKNRAGFTLAELLLAVAILVILFGLGFVAVNAYLRNLRLNEMDWTAKEIFIAAQNQLSKAKENGTLQTYIKNYKETPEAGTKDIKDKDSGDEDNRDLRHIRFSGNGDVTGEEGWKMLMPFGAIDETVRLGGSYIIQFDLTSATVTRVYYSNNYKLNDDDYGKLNGQIADHQISKEFRKYYGGDKRGTGIIGFYEGDSKAFKYEEIEATPILEVENKEKLIAKILGVDPNKYTVRLCIRGLSSGATKTQHIERDLDLNYIMDDVTALKDNHFVNKITSDTDKAFIPGENIEVFVTVMTSKADTLSNVKESNHIVTNSLFASADFENGGTAAQIANFRHLQNLDALMSGIPYGTGETQINLASAEQINDMKWSDFLTAVSNNSIVTKDDTNAGSWNGTKNYYPLSNLPKTLSYEGNNRFIDGISVGGVTKDAGLFGTVAGTALTVSDLELRNFNINTGGSAGALAGAFSESTLTVSNVIAYNTVENDDALAIVSAKSAGGLIGSATNVNITNSAAAVYVKGGTTAGGLAGNLGGGKIENSYTGGHTRDGVFTFGEGVTDTSKGRPNVQATAADGMAGGLVGSNNTTVSNSYSAASAYAASGRANLFVGNSDVIPEGCYAAGWTYKDGKIVYPDLWMEDLEDNAVMEKQESKYNYDPFWDDDYYPYKAVGNDDVWFLKNHVGDWALPGPRVDVTNTN